jgi:hypothetical protein
MDTPYKIQLLQKGAGSYGENAFPRYQKTAKVMDPIPKQMASIFFVDYRIHCCFGKCFAARDAETHR